MCQIQNWLTFNLFVSLWSETKLFQLQCNWQRRHGVLSYPLNSFFPFIGYKYLHAIILGMLYAHGGRSPKAHYERDRGLEHREDSTELKLITVALSRIVHGSFLILLWQEVLWASCAKSGANAAFLLLFSFLPPQDGSQHSDYLCIFKHGTIYFLKSLMYS